jgi:uncharacterized protein YqgC (DUF456 family)
MEIFLTITGILLILTGLLGCIIPGLPGPPLSYFGVIIQQFRPGENTYTIRFLVIWGLITLTVTVLDYIIPIYGIKRFGGTKNGIYGSVAGLLIGIFFFPPIGIIAGPFIGAYLGELSSGKNASEALRASIGSLIGFLTGTAAKLVVSGMLTYYFVQAVF